MIARNKVVWVLLFLILIGCIGLMIYASYEWIEKRDMAVRVLLFVLLGGGISLMVYAFITWIKQKRDKKRVRAK